jgi:hypothetical protein
LQSEIFSGADPMTIHADTRIPSDAPLQTDRTEQETDSYVGECGVTVCRFNKSRTCYAGSIEVALVDGMAHCATFDPKERTDLFEANTAESI